jgi:hypothetical protein
MLTEYEQRREARIARNREILLRLVGDLPAHKALLDAGQHSSPPPKYGAKRKATSVPEGEQRRSGRIRNMPAPIHTSFEVDEDLGDVGARAARREARRKASTKRSGVDDSTNIRHVKGPAKPPAPLARGSIKTLCARIDDVTKKYLGCPISDGTGALKAAVIHALAPISNPRFSKYSGIQEWKNCVCLFVNVGDKNGNSYDNVFTHAGGRVSWFAQPAQHEDTPVIARILETAETKHDATQDATAPKSLGGVETDEEPEEALDNDVLGDETKTETETDLGRNDDEKTKLAKREACWPLHFFARMEGCEYVYCGRLRVLEYFPKTSPMKFLFRLLDAPLLRHSDDFLGLVDLADADASLGEREQDASAASRKMKQEKEIWRNGR